MHKEWLLVFEGEAQQCEDIGVGSQVTPAMKYIQAWAPNLLLRFHNK